MTLIEKLKVGDVVRDSRDRNGRVITFKRDIVMILWFGVDLPTNYTNADLAAHGIAKVSPFDDNAEDTEPGRAMVAGE